jgi:C4-dicarboxylate transporter, DctQ subunit
MNRLKSVATAVELTAAVVLAGATVLTFVSVVSRYLFARPIPDQYDVSRLLLGVLIAWGIATCTVRREHIDVDLLWSAMRPFGRRILDVLAMSASLLFLALAAYQMVERTLAVLGTGERTFDLGLPIWPWYALTSLGISAAALAACLRLVLLFGRGGGGEPL